MKNEGKIYCAISHCGKYRVATIETIEGVRYFKLLGDVRIFDKFDAADRCAQQIANGEFPDVGDAGRYVSMR